MLRRRLASPPSCNEVGGGGPAQGEPLPCVAGGAEARPYEGGREVLRLRLGGGGACEKEEELRVWVWA